MADISLLFDVAMGGGNPSGDSEQLIRSQLEAIVNGINAKPFSIKFQADEASLQQFQKRVSEIAISLGNGVGTSSAAFEQVTRQINIAATAIHTMNGAVNASNLERISTALSGLAGANISDGAIADIVSRLESMSVVLTDARIQFEDLGKTGERVPRLIIEGVDAAGNAIRRNLRFDNKGELERDLTDITVKLAEVEKASKGSGTSTKSAGEKATDAFTRAKKAVTDYYNALTQLERSGLRNVITQGADGTWSSSQTGYEERVAQLNRLTQEYHNATAARQTFTASQQAEFTEHETARAQQYRVAVEDVARAEQHRQETLRSTVTITRSYDNTIADCQKKLKDWSAAENSRHQSSRDAYDALRNEVTAAERARIQYNNGEISIEQYTAAMDRLKSTLVSTKATLQQNGDAAKTFGERLAGLAKKFASWLGVSQIIMYIYRSIRKMVSAVIELDTAMTELKKVTDETDATYDKFLRNAATRAKSIGASLTDVVNTTADFARLGLSLEDAEYVSDAALVYKNVGDGIEDIDHASESLISTMQAFGIEAKDVMSIVDKFNVTGNKFAISSGGIGDALLNSAAALDAAGNTLDESIALITAANTTIQNPEKVGTALKTISMYLRAAKTEAEEAGESTEGMADSVSELRDELLALTGGRVDIQIDEDTFKSTYQILKDLSEVWGDLSDISQANITELIGGKRNANVISALLQDFEIAEDVISKTATASGSALEENAKVLESIQGKINVFKATFQELSNNLIGSDLVKMVVDIGTSVISALNWITKLVDSMGGVKTVLLGVASVLMITKAEWIAHMLAVVKNFVVTKLTSALTFLRNLIPNIISIVKTCATTWYQYATGATTAAGATVTASAAMQATIPVIGLLLAAFTAIIGALTLFGDGSEDAATAAREEAEALAETRREMQQAADTAADYSDKLSDLVMKYLSASNALDTLNGSVGSYVSARDELIESLQIEQSELDSLINKYGSYEKAIANASLAKLQDSEIDLRLGVDSNNIKDNAEHISASMTELADSEGNVYQDLLDEINEALAVLNAEFGAEYVSKFWGTVAGIGSAKGSKFVVNIPQNDAPEEYTDMYGDNAKYVYYYEGYKKLIGELQSAGIGEGHPLYDGLVEQYNAIKEPVEAYLASVQKLNDNLATQYVLMQTLASDGVPKTKSEFDAFRKGIIDSAVASGEFVGSVTDVENAVDNALRSSPDFANFYESADVSTQSLSSLADTVKKLKSNYDLLATAQSEMSSGEGLSPETIQSLASETDRYLDYLYEENGVIKLNTEAWKAYANEKMLGDISAIEDEISLLQSEKTTLENELATLQSKTDLTNEESERVRELNGLIAENTAAIEANQSKLNIYSSLYNNISGSLDAYSAALQNFSNISNAITSVSNSLETVANLQKEVADGFTISLDKALEFASVYPEILNGATVAADGQIALNQGVVNAFITGKEAELKAQIDAEVAKLEADKAVLTAKMEFSKAQLELAKSVGTGEGQISKEVAEYRVNAGNAVAQALIAAGIDEATAYQLACAAMAQNSEEFNRVAAEVCTDVQGNFNQAAYDAAQAIYTNMQNSKLSIASVAAQAHEAAKAIAGIASGTVQGSSSVNSSGAGGSYTGKGSITVHSGSFKGTEYTYDSKTISLEDFISDLELDISSYSKAISQIDGQIATLKALRNTSLEKFETSSGSGGGSKNKEPSWFEEEYALHQHLLKMDAENVEDYLDWLNEAYQRAYKEGIIDLDEYYKYQEEVYTGLQDLFKDYLSDVEHEISMRENYDGEAKKIIELYEGLIENVEKEIAAARARGLTDEDDYIQELQKKWQDYTGSIEDLRDEITESAKDALDELIDYRIDMLKQEIEDEKDALDKRLDNLKEFYDKQKEMLQDQRDEENYLKDQSEKRKTVTDLQAELAMLANDDSAWAQKRKLELQEEITTAQEDLDEFEKDHALDLALDALDKAYNDQEAQIQAEMDALEERLNDPEALYNKALEDIRKNSENQLYYQMLMYNRQYGDGNDETVKDLWESAFGALSDYEKLFGELYKGVDLENETGVEDEGGWDDEKISGTNPDNQQPTPPPPADDTAKEETATPQLTDDIKKKVAAAIWNGGYGWGTGSTRTQRLTEVFGAGNGIQALVNKGVGRSGVSLTNEYTYANMRKKFKGYASGTDNATPGWHELFEGGLDEYIFTSSDGSRYRMFSGLGDKVLNGAATDFLYDFANSGGTVLTKMLADLLKVGGFGNITKPVQAIEIHSGDVVVQGNATERTVSEIRRAQRDNLEFVLKELNRLNK